ncbi:MAG: HD domain-containing protein [candidate division Zixibacteria bacterium]|nr:HD domain-containing protein [candidate division Zixibacteria bacterium]
MPASTHISEKAIKAISKLGKLYEVGGAVRDDLLGLPDAGYDRDYLVTGVKIDDLIGALEKTGRVDVVGKSFGVIKYTEFSKANGESVSNTFDIALPRVETSHGHGHKEFTVEYDPDIPIEEDLGRRDFTVNAMARSVTVGEVIDPYGGREDLKNYTLRMVAPNSFAEDPLRMLRGAQFAARFDLIIEGDTWSAMRENAELVKTISAERIAEELNKLLTKARRPSAGFRIMRETGLLEHILPELMPSVGCDQPGGYHRWNVFEHTLRVLDAAPVTDTSLRLRLACLFHDIEKPQCKREVEGGVTFYGHETLGAQTAARAMKRLRYSHELTAEVSTLVERHMFTTDVTDKGLRRLVRKVGVDLIFDLLELRRADVIGQGMGGSTDDVDVFEAEIRAELERKPPFGRSDLALNGSDLMRLFDLPPGPFLGDILDHLLEMVLDNPDDNTPDRLTAIAREFLEKSRQ